MKHRPDHRFLLLCYAGVLLLSGCREDTGDAAARRAEAVLAHSTGVGFLSRDQLSEAEAEFRKVVELAPRDPIGHTNLGLTYWSAGWAIWIPNGGRPKRFVDVTPEGGARSLSTDARCSGPTSEFGRKL